MNRYLILYGAENEMATFEANDVNHAIEQFCNWAPVSPDYIKNLNSINEVNFITPINNWNNKGILYAHCSDGSYFGANDLEITLVPENIENEDIEDFIFNREP